ncbi:putative toxin-antitoxin system toxin component, PIN family [Candidatus Woesearchaeota archaeon]|nr:putative toxin-antitoxin system toxin component, PIN family [Candidatus Woesearchaeota archaeon]
MRITVDTNILVSATFWYGDSFRIIKLAENKQLTLVLSDEILEEYYGVLNYDEIKQKIELNNLEAKFTLIKLRLLSEIVKSLNKIDVIKDDPDDNIILECAISGNVDYIISHDKHLLNLNNYNNIKIITAREFLKLIIIYCTATPFLFFI